MLLLLLLLKLYTDHARISFIYTDCFLSVMIGHICGSVPLHLVKAFAVNHSKATIHSFPYLCVLIMVIIFVPRRSLLSLLCVCGTLLVVYVVSHARYSIYTLIRLNPRVVRRETSD